MQPSFFLTYINTTSQWHRQCFKPNVMDPAPSNCAEAGICNYKWEALRGLDKKSVLLAGLNSQRHKTGCRDFN